MDLNFNLDKSDGEAEARGKRQGPGGGRVATGKAHGACGGRAATGKAQVEHGSNPGGGKCDRFLKKTNPLRQTQGGPGPASSAKWSLHFVHNLCLV